MFKKMILVTTLCFSLNTTAQAFEETGIDVIDGMVKILAYAKACKYEISSFGVATHMAKVSPLYKHLDGQALSKQIGLNLVEISFLVVLDPKAADLDNACPVFKQTGIKLGLVHK